MESIERKNLLRSWSLIRRLKKKRVEKLAVMMRIYPSEKRIDEEGFMKTIR